MYTIQDYKKVDDLDEAYKLNQKKSSAIIGGGMWLRLGKRPIGTAIDMSALGLDDIEENEDEFIIGCMTSLRALECHEGLNRYFRGMFKDMMRGIVGTQFRNTATIGGSIYQRFGFSDPLTGLLALDTEAELYAGGKIPLDTFAAMKYDRDILVRIYVKKQGCQAAYQSFRHTKTDFPVLTAAASRTGGKWKLTVGARPGRAVVVPGTSILPSEPTQEEIKSFAGRASEQLHFEANMRAGAEYRKLLSEVLIERAVMSVLNQGLSDDGRR